MLFRIPNDPKVTEPQDQAGQNVSKVASDALANAQIPRSVLTHNFQALQHFPGSGSLFHPEYDIPKEWKSVTEKQCVFGKITPASKKERKILVERGVLWVEGWLCGSSRRKSCPQNPHILKQTMKIKIRRGPVSPPVLTVAMRPLASKKTLQPLREIGLMHKTQSWSEEDIHAALLEANLKGISPESLYGTATLPIS